MKPVALGFATFIRVKDNRFIQGAPRTEFQGVLHRTEWSKIEAPAQLPLESTAKAIEADETVA